MYLRVIDLGMGKRVFTERVITDDIVGTQGYHPPEVLLEEGHDFKADIFMLGISFSIMVSILHQYFKSRQLPPPPPCYRGGFCFLELEFPDMEYLPKFKWFLRK